MYVNIQETKAVDIHNIQSVTVSAVSLDRINNSNRFHVQTISIVDDEGKEFSIGLFFDKTSQVLPVGDLSKLDQADSNEDYMGVIEGESVAF
jgi:hypothetical protein